MFFIKFILALAIFCFNAILLVASEPTSNPTVAEFSLKRLAIIEAKIQQKRITISKMTDGDLATSKINNKAISSKRNSLSRTIASEDIAIAECELDFLLLEKSLVGKTPEERRDKIAEWLKSENGGKKLDRLKRQKNNKKLVKQEAN